MPGSISYQQPSTVSGEAQGDPRRQRHAQLESISERTQRVQPNMSDNLLAAARHYHRKRAVSVHPQGSVLRGSPLPSTSAVSLARGASSRTGALSSTNRVNDRG